MLHGLPAATLASIIVAASAPDTAGPAPAASAAWAAPARWSGQRAPVAGPPRSIGAYAGGCLQGASSLPPSGAGYELMHPRRRRCYGHPALIDFIRRLGAAARDRRLGLVLIGDLSQARGGPTPTGHRSHQTGLDVDVAYAAPLDVPSARLRRAAWRERASPPAVVDLATHTMTTRWGRAPAALLAAAASDPSVDRVFVNPSVKRALCQGPARGEPWFARVRPWWGHHDHFHVRLKCPADSPLCQAQEAPVDDAANAGAGADRDDGCGASLDWWFSPDALVTQSRRKQADQASGATLPDACASLIAKP
jgi:penicillin-insensitive murein endopeptidase